MTYILREKVMTRLLEFIAGRPDFEGSQMTINLE